LKEERVRELKPATRGKAGGKPFPNSDKKKSLPLGAEYLCRNETFEDGDTIGEEGFFC